MVEHRGADEAGALVIAKAHGISRRPGAAPVLRGTMPSAKSKALVTRAAAPGRGGAKRVAITAAGLAVIEAMAAEGNDNRTIAKRLGINKSTLEDIRDRDPAVAEAWERGHAALADELTHILLSHARKGNVVAAIYLTKARLGWREGTPAEGHKQAVQVNIQIPPPMSEAEFRAITEGRASGAPEPGDATVQQPATSGRVVR